MKIQEALEIVKGMAVGGYCSASCELTGLHGGRIEVECSVYVGGRSWTMNHSTFEGAISEMAAKLGVPDPIKGNDVEVEI